MTRPARKFHVRQTAREDIAQIIELCRAVYPGSIPWNTEQLSSHQQVFPEGQFVVASLETGQIVGMAASLIVLWDDYDMNASWRKFTEDGTFRNHNPEAGRTLYGAEVMVHPRMQGRGIGKMLYCARRNLAVRLGLLRIRAGARLRGYNKFAGRLSPEEYVKRVEWGEIRDPTLSFQIGQGFHVLAVVQGYLAHDNESLGYAAVIEWINERVAKPEDSLGRDMAFTSRGGVSNPPPATPASPAM